MHRQGNETAAQKFLEPGSAADEFASYIDNASKTLTQDDFLAVAFDMSNAQDRAAIDALTQDKEGFQAWRENMARTSMHMELSDYSALFEHHRSSLLDLAAEMNIPVQVNKISFDALLRKVDAEVSVRERRAPKGAAAFVEARVAVAALHQNAHLFQSRSNLHSLLVSDAIVYGVGTQIGKAFDWMTVKIKENKCKWCKSVVDFFIKKACDAAGKALCMLLVSLAVPPLGAIIAKLFCDFPLYLGKLLGSWCTAGIKWLQDKTRMTSDCMCSFTIPTMTLPATNFATLGVTIFSSTKRVIALGQVCPTQPGQCAGSSDADKKAYDIKKAADDAAKAKKAAKELERIKKMTKAEKIAYHTKILKGEVLSSLDKKIVNEVLGTVTGLGTTALGALAKAGGKVLSGDFKGAGKELTVTVGKQVAKKVVKTIAQKAVKVVVSTAAGVAVDKVTEGAKAITSKVSEVAGQVYGNKTRAVGHIITDIKTAVTADNATDAARIRQQGYAVADKVGAAVNKGITTVGTKVSNVMIDGAKVIVNANINERYLKPADKDVGKKLESALKIEPEKKKV